MILIPIYCSVVENTVSYENYRKPWIDSQLLDRIKKRTNYHILYKGGKISRNTYCRFRNMVKSEIRSKKSDLLY